MKDELERLQAEIEALTYHDFVQLRQWFSEKDWELWDEEIEADSAAGKLDFLFDEALKEKPNTPL